MLKQTGGAFGGTSSRTITSHIPVERREKQTSPSGSKREKWRNCYSQRIGMRFSRGTRTSNECEKIEEEREEESALNSS
jgi:hypothetical protein